MLFRISGKYWTGLKVLTSEINYAAYTAYCRVGTGYNGQACAYRVWRFWTTVWRNVISLCYCFHCFAACRTLRGVGLSRSEQMCLESADCYIPFRHGGPLNSCGFRKETRRDKKKWAHYVRYMSVCLSARTREQSIGLPLIFWYRNFHKFTEKIPNLAETGQ